MAVTRTLGGMAIACACAASTASAAGLDYPNKSIRFLVAVAPGGSTDSLARLIGQKLSESLGQQVVMDNRPGGGGLVGLEVAAKAAPDGYTLLAGGTGSIAINPSLYKDLPYDPVKQFAPVIPIAYSSSVLVVHPSVTAKNVAELIALAKAKPGGLRYASAGGGSSPHLSATVFRTMAGVDITHVPYKGSTPGVLATVSGETSLMFTGVASALGQIKSGRLRALSVNGPKRSPALPDVPTAGESGLPGFEVDFWIGVFVPTGTPRAVIAKLNSEINRIISSPGTKDTLLVLGADPVGGSPEQFGALVRKDLERWAQIVKASGMKAE